jgi:hypothetical protein
MERANCWIWVARARCSDVAKRVRVSAWRASLAAGGR